MACSLLSEPDVATCDYYRLVGERGSWIGKPGKELGFQEDGKVCEKMHLEDQCKSRAGKYRIEIIIGIAGRRLSLLYIYPSVRMTSSNGEEMGRELALAVPGKAKGHSHGATRVVSQQIYSLVHSRRFLEGL